MNPPNGWVLPLLSSVGFGANAPQICYENRARLRAMNKPASLKVLVARQNWLLMCKPTPTKARISEPLWFALKTELYNTAEAASLYFDERKNEDWIGSHVFGMDFDVDPNLPPDFLEILQ